MRLNNIIQSRFFVSAYVYKKMTLNNIIQCHFFVYAYVYKKIENEKKLFFVLDFFVKVCTSNANLLDSLVLF